MKLFAGKDCGDSGDDNCESPQTVTVNGEEDSRGG